MSTEDYLAAFDLWLSLHVNAALKAGKDLAYCDRHFNSSLKLDEYGSAWDYVMLEPGAIPPGGRAWSVCRLHGVLPQPAAKVMPEKKVVSLQARRERNLIGRMAEVLFTPPPQPKIRRAKPNLRLVG